MESEGALLSSQELSTCPYPEPDQSTPHHPIPSLQDSSQCEPTTYILVFLVKLYFPHITKIAHWAFPELDKLAVIFSTLFKWYTGLFSRLTNWLLFYAETSVALF
jgi:hypothetical protein